MTDIRSLLTSLPTKLHWAHLGLYPKQGINLSLASLHSRSSCGIGEFMDLLPIIDWCQEVGFQVIQLLPLNDSGRDPSPYNALSSCALNPIYLSLHQLPYLDKQPKLQKALGPLHLLCSEQRVDYQRVLEYKMNWLRDYVETFENLFSKDLHFKHFSETFSWLKTYSLFRALKDLLKEENWENWPPECRNPSAETLSYLLEKHAKEIQFYMILQYLCAKQLSFVKQQARAKKIFLKGDIPILISPDSADVWSNPQLFNTTLAAGSPPDAYNAEGQYWGFPLIRWEELEQSDFKWWKERVLFASEFYDLFRIDHVVGFFRIWAIPLHESSKEGKFLPEDPNLWIPRGKKILEELLKTTFMLPIAEDLGVVPSEVREILSVLGICGTKVMRWEREWEKEGLFIPYSDYPMLSLTTVSTHDSETLALWWRDEREAAHIFASSHHWSYQPELSVVQRKKILWESHHTPSLFHINLLQEYLALIPELIWSNLEDERINIPGKALHTNWTYRFRPSVEKLTTHALLKQHIKDLFKPSFES